MKDAQVIRSEMVRLHDGRAMLSIPYDPEFKDELTVVAYADLGADDVVHDGHSILYPFDRELKLDVNPAQDLYRPGEEAHVGFNVRSANGRATESALGVTVFDRAVEERARTDQEFGSSSDFYGNYAGLLGWDDSLAGVTRKDLERLDLSKPVTADLSLLAEVMLNKTGGYYPNFFGGKEYELDAVKIFAPLINEQLKPVQDALNARYAKRMEYPSDEASLQRILTDSGINFAALSDPWGEHYRAVFSVENEKDVLRIYSAGADKRFDTPDDFSVVVLSWPYFRPVGEAIDRAIQKYHARTGGYIRDAATLSSELTSEGTGSDKLLDRWGEPYRLEFGVDGVHYILRVRSGGANRKFEAAKAAKTDDFIVWTSMIDYFAERRVQIDTALDSQWKEKHSFPQDMKSLRTLLHRAQIDFDSLRDPWGHGFYATFKTESRFTDRAEIEVRAKYGEKGQTHTEIKPVTQKTGNITIRSAGADGKQGTADDFDAATFTIVLSEQTARDAKPQGVRTYAILSGKGGAITGTITDMLGAVVPNANVKATLSSTAQFYETTTDSEGKFILRNLPSGTYEVLVTSPGFKNTVTTGVLVSKANIVQLNISLEAGSVSEMVTVVSDTAQVQTSSATISSRQIMDLPSNGSSVSRLALLAPGVAQIITKSGGGQVSTPRLREYFPETLLWQPSLETDAQGRAELRFKLADNITTWKLSVIGSTTTGEIGIAEKEIRAFQPFFVEHDPPRVLTVGDEIELPVVVRNYLDKPQSVHLEIKPESWFQLLGAAEKRAEVPAGDNSRQTFAFRATSFVKEGKQRVTATASDANDQIERPVSVHPDGEEIAHAASGILSESATLEANIPADAINGTAHAELKIYPNLMAHVVESIEAIMQRPYGCGEQTISSAYPSLLALRAYKRMGLEPPDIGTKARRYVQAGYERLLNYRAMGGGFSYWGRGEADLALTAYALRFLHDAQEFIEVDQGVMREAREWLVKQQRADGTWPVHVWERTEDKRRTAQLTAYIAHILALTNEKESANQTTDNTALRQSTAAALKRALRFLSTACKEIDEPYLIAAYALAAFDAGDRTAAQVATDKLRTLVHDEGDVSYWSLETNTPFYGWGLAGRIETTALVLQALFRDYGFQKGTESQNPQSAIRNPQSIDRGLLFLLRQQDRYGVWYSTQATVNTLDTLTLLLSKDSSSLRQADASSGSRASAAEQAEVFVNGRPATTLELPPEDRLANPITLDLSRFISPGSNRIEIRRAASAARASVQVVSAYYVPWTAARRTANHSSAEDSSSALRLNVSYDRSAARVGDEITCRVAAERIGFKGYGMLLAEIGLPPGADVDRATLERAMKDSGWSLSRYDVLPDRLIVYLWPQAGGTRFEFKFHPRFGLAAQTAPSLLYDYYNPEARVVVAPTKFVVR